jgi:hypothetical protein
LRVFIKKIIPYFLIPTVLVGLEIIINKNSNDGFSTKILKLINSNKRFDICFYGDSKNQWNFNYETLKKEFPSLTFYNFSLGGFSSDDIATFYDSNICNCKLNIINLNETTQNNNVINSKSSYILQSLYMFNFLNPVNMINTYHINYEKKKNRQNIKNGFYNISNVDSSSKDINNYEVDEIIDNISQKYHRLSLKIINSEVIFIIHSDRDFRKKYLYKNFGKEFLLKLHKLYFKNYELIDFRDMELLTEDSLFYDTQHFNKKGSIIFTKIFSDSLRNKKYFGP